ncbi:MAG: LPS export ABC transporter periplasmic protein LptC [Pelagibacteraceae bacterium]
MTTRKKKIFLIQLFIFLIAITLIFLTYKPNNQPVVKEIEENKKQVVEANKTRDPKVNSFEKVEYKGVDLNGNRYLIKSEKAEFTIDKPELINMDIMNTTFYFKDGTILYVTSDTGTYNNVTNDMEFRENVKAIYENNYLFADNLDYFNSKGSLSIYGNVKSEGVQGVLKADNLEFDINKKTLDISMFSDEQINVKLNNKKK